MRPNIRLVSANSGKTGAGLLAGLAYGTRPEGATLLVVGATVYSFGLYVVPFAEAFGLTRAQANTGMMMLNVGIAVWSPIAGSLLDRVPAARVVVFVLRSCAHLLEGLLRGRKRRLDVGQIVRRPVERRRPALIDPVNVSKVIARDPPANAGQLVIDKM